MISSPINLSFEFFPPQDVEGLEKLLSVAKKLSALNPEFFSVTYGAGGSTRDNTKQTVQALRDHFDVPVAPHLSCIGSTRETITRILDEYIEMGIKKIVALRGDLPSGMRNPGDFSYASDLVTFIREHSGDHFEIKVAAYPEFHPESKSSSEDLSHFKGKIEAGAQAAITQFFFNTEAYLHFVEDCRAMGVAVPIIAGIMPISNWERLMKFSRTCGMDLPIWLKSRMDALGTDEMARRNLSIKLLSHLCQRLQQAGVTDFHFYTLNQSKLSLAICESLLRVQRDE